MIAVDAVVVASLKATTVRCNLELALLTVHFEISMLLVRWRVLVESCWLELRYFRVSHFFSKVFRRLIHQNYSLKILIPVNDDDIDHRMFILL